MDLLQGLISEHLPPSNVHRWEEPRGCRQTLVRVLPPRLLFLSGFLLAMGWGEMTGRDWPALPAPPLG